MNSANIWITVGNKYLIKKDGELMEFMVNAIAGEDYFHVVILQGDEAKVPYWDKWMTEEELKGFLKDVEMMTPISVQGNILIS